METKIEKLSNGMFLVKIPVPELAKKLGQTNKKIITIKKDLDRKISNLLEDIQPDILIILKMVDLNIQHHHQLKRMKKHQTNGILQ